ncbi:uncharacterized protein LOC123207344 [Mangifera indica]|uniref:uncharacterized protein LOC123207344 n=1 Tax=Mangifera indica TaxID=29780 RepID=UPI001CFB168C|nr:uncharacterized protein LOC123207344 [Mangifera indica]
MNQAIRSFTANPLTVLSSPLPYRFGQKASVVKFRQLTTQYRRPENSSSMESKEKKDPNNTQEKSGDVMSHSFGEGYSTRSDEEGFGGTCGSNQFLPKDESEKGIHENHPAYDKTQGSEVKEKEKGRHQTQASN